MERNLLRFAVFFSAGVTTLSVAQMSKPVVMAYYPSDAAYGDLVAMHSYFSHVATDSFTVDAKGNIFGTAPVQAVKTALTDKISPYAMFSNYGATDFDPVIAHSILANPTYQSKFLNGVKSILVSNHFQGVNIDFEGVLSKDRAIFTAFLKAVVAKMKPGGYKVAVSVPAKTIDDPADGWSGAFDYIAIGKIVDLVQVMTYDEFGAWSTPGTVAGLDWMTQSLRYAASVIASPKILLGLPAYANDWNLSDSSGKSNVTILWKDIPALLKATGGKPVRDTATYSMHFRYRARNGTAHEVWYEDVTSIAKKSNLYLTYKLGGVSVWALGQETSSFWDAVLSGMKPSKDEVP